MSRHMNAHKNKANVRWHLLVTVSTAALLGATYGTGAARAADSNGDRPLIWVELDGQFAQQENGQEDFVPAFMQASPFGGASQAGLEKIPPTIWDKGAKITFEPNDSDWILSLGIRYGRSGRREVRNQITAHPTNHFFGILYTAYQNLTASSSEGHTVLDFQVGKDVGLGRLGSDGSSILSLGVRYAQFNVRSNVGIQSKPANTNYNYNKFYASFAAQRKFAGIGPSLSWDASAELAGNSSAGSLAFDWGANAAILFGRQRMRAHHQTTNTYQASNILYGPPRTTVYHYPLSPARSKSVTVPNVGGFAAVSWKTSNAKISFGYRADYFFNVLDGGIDTAKKEDRSFYGPFVSIAVGIGD